jgi:hypothetical protein
MVLDSLLERLTGFYPMDEGLIRSPEVTFRPLLFNLWSRLRLNVKPCFSGISPGQAKDFFQQLRAGSDNPPYRMAGFEETFVGDFMAYASDTDAEAASILNETLSLIWKNFMEEYQFVNVDDLDGRYLRHISIASS